MLADEMTYMFVQLATQGAYRLTLSHYVSEGFVDAETDHQTKPHVKELQLGCRQTHRLSDLQLRNISNGLVNLERLVINRFWYVTEEGYQSLFANIKQLRSIEVGEDQFTDGTFATLANQCRSLEDVTIHNHVRLRRDTIQAFIVAETPLVRLKIVGCFYLSSAVEALVSKCKTLETLYYTGNLSSSAMKTIFNSSVRNFTTYMRNVRMNGDFVLPEQSAVQVTYLDDDDDDDDDEA